MSDTQKEEIATKVAKTTETKATEVKKSAPISTAQASTVPAFEKNRSRIRSKRDNRRSNDGQPKEKDPFDFKIINIRRVNKMYKGGRRMKLSVVVVVGDKKGKVGIGLGKADDVRGAQEKAIAQ